MKNYQLFVTILFYISCCIAGFADEEMINLQNIGHHGDHSEYYHPADMPEVYYDADNLEIIIVADGFASYYNVDITSASGYVPLISTQVDGYGDSIDVSSLPDGYYSITITSSNNNQFEGTFAIE